MFPVYVKAHMASGRVNNYLLNLIVVLVLRHVIYFILFSHNAIASEQKENIATR